MDLTETGLNLYDVRKSCDRSKDGDLCYKQMTWIDTWMNLPVNKAALGVNPDIKFQSCNMQVSFVTCDVQFQGRHLTFVLSAR
jgi:cathepsin A (carboxypeptidase C)